MDFLKDKSLIIEMVNKIKTIDKKIDSLNKGEEYINLLEKHLSKIVELDKSLRYYQHKDYSNYRFKTNEQKLVQLADLEKKKVALLNSFEGEFNELKNQITNQDAIKESLSLYKKRNDLLEKIHELTQTYSETFPINNIAKLYGHIMAARGGWNVMFKPDLALSWVLLILTLRWMRPEKGRSLLMVTV